MVLDTQDPVTGGKQYWFTGIDGNFGFTKQFYNRIVRETLYSRVQWGAVDVLAVFLGI